MANNLKKDYDLSMQYSLHYSTLKALVFSLLGGMLYASGFPLVIQHSFVAGPILGFLLFSYSLLELSHSLKKQMLIALTFSVGFYLFGFYWIPHTLMEFGGLTFPFNQLLGLLFSIFIIPQVYFYTFLQRKIHNTILLSIAYVLLEEFIPQQFPAHLGHSFLALSPAIPLKLAPYFGAPIYSFFSVLIALSVLNHIKNKKPPMLSYGFILLLIACNFLLPTQYKGTALPTLNLRIIQPNIGNFLKLDSEKGDTNSLKNVFDNYIKLSTSPSAFPLDLIIWPETAFPTLISSEILKRNPSHSIPPTLYQIIDQTGAELFLGGYDFNPTTGLNDYENQYNAAFLFGADKKLKEAYRKMHLIPFGEGLPFGPLNPILSKYITNISYFAEGKTFSAFKTKSNIPFISVICYEILFPDFIRNFLNHQIETPQFLINLTNDSWYGDTAEPFQHLFLAKWRALEFNIPLIRSTNTGITTIIYPDGSESNRLTHQEKKSLDVELKMFTRKDTIFQKFGLWMIITISLMFYLIEIGLKKTILRTKNNL